MKNIILLFLFIASFTGYAQSIEGKWQSEEDPELGMEFNNGDFTLLNLKNPGEKVLQNITVKYKIAEDEKGIIIFEAFAKGQSQGIDKAKFRIEKDKLYLLRPGAEESDDVAGQVVIKREEVFKRIR